MDVPWDFHGCSMDVPSFTTEEHAPALCATTGPGQRLRGVFGLAAADVRQRAGAAAHGAELRREVRSRDREKSWLCTS